MRTIIFDKETFLRFAKLINTPDYINLDTFYDVYKAVNEGVVDVMNKTEGFKFTPINPGTIILYIVNEFIFSLKNYSLDKKIALQNDENFLSQLASTCADKYLTNEQLNYKSTSYLNRFNPPISTLSLYLNFTLRTLNEIKPSDKYNELISDMLKKAFSMGKCILELLNDGFETEAFSTWRTLHENECILSCLIKYGENIFKAYFRHITYALAYRGQVKDKEECDKIFVEIKENMKKHDLKSKDMKKYIEYGYLFAIPNIKLNEDFKLNFRDGIEKLAGLSGYSKTYEMSSEISHSSPLLIFSNKEYYFVVTLVNLYETFFRLENIFDQFYRHFTKKELWTQYYILKNTYIRQLHFIYLELVNKVKKSTITSDSTKENNESKDINN